MYRKRLKPGAWVVYSKQKFSTSPGPRAKNVNAASKGETYCYFVDKYWAVRCWVDDDTLLLFTRTGKEHAVLASDQNLRLAIWWERWLFVRKFPARTHVSTRES